MDAAMPEAGKYEISGTAEGLPCTLWLTVEEPNLLLNSGFESGDFSGWTVTDLKKADQLYNENKASDSLGGTWHLHFWSAAKDSVEFTCEQEVRDLTPGKYKFSISIMGGDGGETEIYAYAKINGQTVATAPMQITTYGSWDTGIVSDIEVKDGDVLTVGIYVKCSGAGNGAWGKVDDAVLTYQ